MRSRVGLLVLEIVLVGQVVAWGAEPPVAVSPGSAASVPIGQLCPTFSWAAGSDATGHELTVFEVEADGIDLRRARLVLETRVPGAATSWTPSLDSCLEAGKRYAWTVRAESPHRGDSWSEPLLFEIARAPEVAALEEEVAQLRELLEEQAGLLVAAVSGAPPSASPRLPRADGAAPAAQATVTGAVALRVENPDTTGEAHGLVGINNSAEGAAMVAENAAPGGADLILKGDGVIPDAMWTEGGINVDSEESVVFSLGNVGSGSLSLLVDGAPVAGTSEVPMTNLVSTVNAGNFAGQFTSMTLGADGLPVISFYDDSFVVGCELKVAKCNDPACTGGDETISVVDNGACLVTIVGKHTSIALGADGLPVISYHDETNGTLKVAKCNDPACAGGDETLTVLHTSAGGGATGLHSAIAVGMDGLPVIAFHEQTFSSYLHFIHCGDAACSGPVTITTVDFTNNVAAEVGTDVSMAIGVTGYPVISYLSTLAGEGLKVAICSNLLCTSRQVIDLTASAEPPGTSITVGEDGYPLISYRDPSDGGRLGLVRCNDTGCIGGDETVSSPDLFADAGRYSSVTIGLDGLPVISHYSTSGPAGRVRFVKCNDPACDSTGGGESNVTVDDGGVGAYSSITVGADGLPLIAYQDVANGNLKVARCANPYCLPYFRRR